MKTNDAVAALAALAQEHRLEVFRLLVRTGAAGLPAGEIAATLGVAAPTLSFHLAHLKHAGLVHVRRDGRSLIYAANYDGMNTLMEFLTDNCCGDAASACRIPVCNPATGTIQRKAAKGTSRR